MIVEFEFEKKKSSFRAVSEQFQSILKLNLPVDDRLAAEEHILALFLAIEQALYDDRSNNELRMQSPSVGNALPARSYQKSDSFGLITRVIKTDYDYTANEKNLDGELDRP